MKIGFTAAGSDLDSLVDERYARAPYLMVVDSETMEYKAVVNQNAEKTSGAGTGASQDLIKEGADVIITINVGPKAWDVLKEFEVKVYRAKKGMTIREAIEAFKRGELEEVHEPTEHSEEHEHHHHH